MKPETFLTNTKLMLSLGVLGGAVFLIFVGTWIHAAVTNGAEQNARMYTTAIQTQGNDQFNYSIDTQQGKILTTATINAVDTVKFPEMNKEFPRVYKTEERYTQHEREVCETKYRTETHTEQVSDGEGGYTTETVTEEVPYEECHEETYYSWDEINHWEVVATKANMNGREYPMPMFNLRSQSIDAKDIITGETGQYVRKEADVWLDLNLFDSDDEGDIRYGYEVMQLPQSGTVFLNTVGGLSNVHGGRISLSSESPKQQVENAQKSAHIQSTVFTIFWAILVLAELLGLGYLVWIHEDH